jgi:hypothetical protein
MNNNTEVIEGEKIRPGVASDGTFSSFFQWIDDRMNKAIEPNTAGLRQRVSKLELERKRINERLDESAKIVQRKSEHYWMPTAGA